MPRNRDAKATQRAKDARKQPSVAEQIMWHHLRGSRLGFKFKREHPIAGYRLDFYCHEAMLVVELDGEQHDPGRDAIRDAVLGQHGLLVFRIPNRQFFSLDGQRPPDEISAIQQLCEERSGRKAFP